MVNSVRNSLGADAGIDRVATLQGALQPRLYRPHTEGITDLLIGGGFGEDQADDGAVGIDKRTAGIAGDDIGLQLVDAAAVDVAAFGGKLVKYGGGAGGQRFAGQVGDAQHGPIEIRIKPDRRGGVPAIGIDDSWLVDTGNDVGVGDDDAAPAVFLGDIALRRGEGV